jgi:hypothetical protein
MQQADVIISTQPISQCTFMSTTAVSYGRLPPGPPPPPAGGGNGGAPSPSSAADGPISLWLLGGGLAIGLLLAILAVVGLYCLCGRHRERHHQSEQEPLFREYKTA